MYKSFLRVVKGKIHSQTKLKLLNMNNGIGVFDTLNQLFVQGSYTKIKFSKKCFNYWQNSVFCDPFCTTYSICLNNDFWQDSFVWKCYAFNHSAFNWKTVRRFFKKTPSFFRNFFFKVKVLKMFKISSDCLVKTYRSLKRRVV